MKTLLEIAGYTAFVLGTLGLSACSSKDDDNTNGANEEAQIAVEDKTIAGVSEKGPFVKGSAVRLYELNAGNLGQTGRAFTGKIASDRGDFRFTHLNLESQYVLLEANGFYRNEVNGKNSAASISLNALVDISDRETANINLLTHLAYERMQHLVDEGSSVTEAKTQAEQEILKAFHVADESIEGFEGLSIFESGKGNAALLAISILMQGSLSEAEFSERLADFAYDIEDDGVWDDNATATKIADWASIRSEGDYYASIRKNIEDWKLSDTISEFEKAVDKFWWENYGLGECDKKAEGESKENKNGKSELANVTFRCKEGRWLKRIYEDWKPYTDSVDGGVSTISFKNAGDTIKAVFDIGKKIGYDYAGLGHWTNERGEPEDYSDCEIVKYSYKGNAHKFVVGSPTNSDDSDYFINIMGSDEWKTAYIPWDYLQYECWGNVCEEATIEKTKKQVTNFTWHFEKTGSIEITDFGCIERKEFLKIEKLEEPCESGEMQTGAASEMMLLCTDKVWKVAMCGDEGTEGGILGDQICLESNWYDKDCDKFLESNGSLPEGYCCTDGKWAKATLTEDEKSYICSEK